MNSNSNESVRAALYVRVSSAGQADKSSLETQEASCRAYATAQGWEICGVYVEVHTGVELWERAQLSLLRDAIRRHELDLVVCHSIDRLSRDATHLGVVISEADHHNVAIAFVTEPLDDSPEGELIRFVRGWAGKIEHEKIKERTMRGKLARVQSGKPTVGPRPPYGLQWVADFDAEGKPEKRRFAEHPQTGPVLRRIFRDAASGVSARQIAIGLSTDGIPSPTGLPVWSRATVIKLLRNPVYTGEATGWRMTRAKVKGKAKDGGPGWVYTARPESERVALPGVAPVVITPDIFAGAGERLAENKLLSIRNSRDPEAALLRGGFARCGECGSVLQVQHNAWGACYRHNQTTRDRYGCPYVTIQASILDAALWADVLTRLGNREEIAARLDAMRSTDPTAGDLAALDRRLADVTRRLSNLTRRMSNEDDDDLAALIKADVQVLLSEQRQLNHEREELDAQRLRWQTAKTQLDDLDRWVKNVLANAADFDYAHKRLALSQLGAQVKVWPKSHTPRYEITLAPATVETTGRSGGHKPIVLRWTDADVALAA